MTDYKLKEHEVMVPLQPIGIKYKCEYCNQGDMIAMPNRAPKMPIAPGGKPLIYHKCTKCGKEMLLTEVYPKIEWMEIPVDENGNVDLREEETPADNKITPIHKD